MGRFRFDGNHRRRDLIPLIRSVKSDNLQLPNRILMKLYPVN